MMGMGMKRMVKFLNDTRDRGHCSVREERTDGSADMTAIMNGGITHTAVAQGCKMLPCFLGFKSAPWEKFNSGPAFLIMNQMYVL